MPYVVAVLMSILGVVGDYFLRVAGEGSRFIEYRLFFTGVFLYALTAVGWFYAIKYMKLETVGIIYSLSTILFLTLLGTLYFGEQLTYFEIAGLVFAVISILLLVRFT